MAEKMLVTQALDERDLLVKKIGAKIVKASFTDVKKRNEEKVMDSRVDAEQFKKDAESAYQQILDLILRFQKIDAAIMASNAATTIHTSFGDYTVAGAISLRSRMRGVGSYEDSADFEQKLYKKMKVELDDRLVTIEDKNQRLGMTAENMRLSILGKDSKAKDDRPGEYHRASRPFRCTKEDRRATGAQDKVTFRAGYPDQGIQCDYLHRDLKVIACNT